MRQAATVFIICGLSALTLKTAGQNDNLGRESMEKMYEKNTPLDFLRILKTDFMSKDQLNIFSMTSSPQNWVKEEHIPELMKLIYSPDSKKKYCKCIQLIFADWKIFFDWPRGSKSN